jgi:hypothetical protein
MAAETEQDQLIKLARLHLSPPEVVFEELKKQAQRSRREWFSYDDTKIEPMLLERNEPLINLGLACFGANREVFRALYKYSLTQSENETDAIYKRGLRIGCLSNQIVAKVHLVMDFPAELIGAEEMHCLIARGDNYEATALVRNPSVSDRFLEALYLRSGPFAAIEEERWCSLVVTSAKNERLNTNEDDEHGPDMGHYSIHKAIFRLLETAPVDVHWLRVLYELLMNLDFRQVAHPDKIDGVISRWATLVDRVEGGEPFEGYYTNVGLKDEFRCLIAALYGRGFSKNKVILHGSATAPDIALRCAFYGKADLTKKDMEVSYERDSSAYVLAVIFNERIYSHPELRKFFEEDQLAFTDLERKYQDNLKLVKQGRATDDLIKPPETISSSVAIRASTTSTESGASWMGSLGYTWRVLLNVFYVAVVLFVFDKLQGRSEVIITVAILGLIYVTIRSIAISQGMGLANALKVIESDLIRLRELVRDEHASDRWEASNADSKALSRERYKLFIDGLSLSVVSIICLWVLFVSLGR